MGISGNLARRFQDSALTPLLALLGLLLGVAAILVTPREEEPQINVTFANVLIPFAGASAREVEHLVTTPAEQVLSEIEGVKHIYSVSRPGMAVLTVEYHVGEERSAAIVRLYNAMFSHRDWLPEGLGVGEPLIKPKGIDDVPIVTITLWTDDPDHGAYELERVAHTVEAELKRVPGTRDIYTVGGPGRVVLVELDPQALAAYGIVVSDLREALLQANQSQHEGALVQNNQVIPLQIGSFFEGVSEINNLLIAMRDGGPVYLRDVATVQLGPAQPEQLVWLGTGPGADYKGLEPDGLFPAVTLAIAKKPGTNAVQVAEQVIERFEQLHGIFIPAGVEATITRNYGETANDKAVTLITKLVLATFFVVLLILLALGWREAVIVGVAVIVTLAVTLFASWAWGFTLNRVSLFALIFSIGILVDDAIVVVENIHRHMAMGGKSIREAIPIAVDEVGNPTILATFTVIAALLPMAFVSGLMGPYMSPIPINASIGMLISLAVAFIVTPWLSANFLVHQNAPAGTEESAGGGWLDRFFQRILQPFLRGREGRSKRRLLLLVMLLLIVASVGLVAAQWVVLKMLPFDNKSEFQVVVDLPEGSSLEQTNHVLVELGAYLATIPEVSDFQLYAGTASPINFNGLVRQYYLRADPNFGDIQVNLIGKDQRERKSHDIARAARAPLQEIGNRFDAVIKISEVPPGPPVMSALVAEVYGPDYSGLIETAAAVRTAFANTTDIVDVDTSVESPAPEWRVDIDRQRAAHFGISQGDVVNSVQAALAGADVTYLHSDAGKYPVPVRLRFSNADRADLESLLALKVRGRDGLVPVSEVALPEAGQRQHAVYHKDLLPVVYVTADMAGPIDSPLYGMFDLVSQFQKQGEMEQYFINQPVNPYEYSLKWDGEWQITYETFRDMGIAYSVGLVLIYLLVVAQFRSYMTPLVIMAPIPLTVIGVMPGHALLGEQFTATSMIGMIALAGIIVRNSILLVDFINISVREGMPLEQAVIRSGAVRAKPIALTGLAAMLGALFILDDPIFSGLAISLIFGILVSTVLTLLVIPVMYYAFQYPSLAGESSAPRETGIQS